jgi:DNA-binding SARP family transcriptional activator
MTSNHYDRNAVEHVPFELLKAMPDITPICERLTREMLHRLARANPRANLNELAYAMQDELGIRPSITHMSRLLRRVGLTVVARRQSAKATENPPLS